MEIGSVSGQFPWRELPTDLYPNIFYFLPPEDQRNVYLWGKQEYAEACKIGLGGRGWGENWKAIPGNTLEEKIHLSRSIRATYHLVNRLDLWVREVSLGGTLVVDHPIDRKELLHSDWLISDGESRYLPHASFSYRNKSPFFLTAEEGEPLLVSLADALPEETYKIIYEGKHLYKIASILEERKNIREALLERPLERENICQDLRNRVFFLRYLENERILLRIALSVNQKTCDELPLWRKALIKISSLFEQAQAKKPVEELEELLAEKEGALTALKERYAVIPMGVETLVPYGNKRAKVEIKMETPLGIQHHKSGMVTFLIFSGGKCFGGLNMRRMWISADGRKHYSEQATIRHGQKVRLRPDSYLICSDWSNGFERDEMWNQPIAPLLVRLAVEIFAREPDQRLVYEAKNPDVLIAMGFREMVSSIKKTRDFYQKVFAPMNHALEELLLEQLPIPQQQEPIERQLRKGLYLLRDQPDRRAKMFPVREYQSPRIPFQLIKYKEREGSQEIKFGVLDENFKPQPTEFLGHAFEKRLETMAYEVFFQEAGFLLPGDPTRPFLPKFLKQDLSKYVVHGSKSIKVPLFIKGSRVDNPSLYSYDENYLTGEENTQPYYNGFIIVRR